MTKIVDYSNTSLLFAEGAAPSTPAAGTVRLYAKADGNLYSKDDAGTETAVTGGGGGSGTVTSVAVANATGITWAGSPITTSGTLTPTLSANLQAWSGVTTASKADDSAVVHLSGTETITGAKTFSANPNITVSAATAQLQIASDAAQIAGVSFLTGSSMRWALRKNNVAESGSNAGSNLVLNAYSDAGSVIVAPVTITRSTGAIALGSRVDELKGADIASAATTDIASATGNFVHITGTTTITALGASVQAGTTRRVVFDGALTLTHNATSLILPTGANITTAAGDSAVFVCEGSGNWRCTDYQRAAGNNVIAQGDGTDADANGFRGIPQNSQSVNYTCVAADAGKHILHPSGGGAGDTFTIPSNASVAFEVGTVLTFINRDSNSVSIAITSDTLIKEGTTTTGTRTLAQNGIATAVKVESTTWIISGGSALT